MLKSMRKHAKYFYVLFFIVIASFVLWGSWTNRGDERGYQTIAEIGSKKITLNEFKTTYSRTMDNLRQMYGAKFNEDIAKSLKKTVLDEMVTNEVLLQAAQKEGITVSDQELSDVITTNPAFIVGGTFRRDRYEQFLRATGQTEDDLRQAITEEKMKQLVLGSIAVSPAELQGLPKMDEKTAGILRDTILRAKQDRALQSYVVGLERDMHIVEHPDLAS